MDARGAAEAAAHARASRRAAPRRRDEEFEWGNGADWAPGFTPAAAQPPLLQSPPPPGGVPLLAPPPSPLHHRRSCHRCGNLRSRNVHCVGCSDTYCLRCAEKAVMEFGDIFPAGCPHCLALCCCADARGAPGAPACSECKGGEWAGSERLHGLRAVCVRWPTMPAPPSPPSYTPHPRSAPEPLLQALQGPARASRPRAGRVAGGGRGHRGAPRRRRARCAGAPARGWDCAPSAAVATAAAAAASSRAVSARGMACAHAGGAGAAPACEWECGG